MKFFFERIKKNADEMKLIDINELVEKETFSIIFKKTQFGKLSLTRNHLSFAVCSFRICLLLAFD